MTDRPSVYRRIQRRETYTSRAVPAITVAIVLILALAYLATEIVLAAAGQQPLLASPSTLVQDIAKVDTVPIGILIGSGAVLAILGVVLLTLALAAGRRPRHVLNDDRAVIMIDNQVIASALVRTAADAGNIDPDRTVGSVSHRTAVVQVTPTSGVSIDRAHISTAITEQLHDWSLTPRLRAKVQIKKAGKVGA